MKKYYFLIIVALILGLTLTGCTLLSNISQVPTTGQSGIAYLTKAIPLPDGLAGLWHLDDDALDSSGNGNDGTVYGGESYVNSPMGKALIFDGVGNYVGCGNDTSLNITQAITIEGWVKPSAFLTTPDHSTIATKAKAYYFQVDGSGYLQVYQYGTSPAGYHSSTNPISLDVWQHVAYTYDGSNVKMFINGVLDTTIPVTGTISASTTHLGIGMNLNAIGNPYSGYYRQFQGTIDEVRIWDEALTAGQIADSYNSGIVLKKQMSAYEAWLGDHITMTLEVATATAVTVVDTLPAELCYIPGTFMVDGVSAMPTVVGQTISYTLDEPCAYTITFDAQVTSVEAELYTVTNHATAGDASASAELTIHPYEGFEKVAVIIYDDNDNGIVEVGELVQWDMIITVPNNFGWPISNATLSDRLGGELGMAGDGVDNNLSGVIDEGVPGDLNSTSNTIPSGTLDIVVRGKANKVQFKITGIDILPSPASLSFVLGIFTDKNPAGKQCYTSDGTYKLNSGAVLKFVDPGTDFQLSAHTPQITVVVIEELE